MKSAPPAHGFQSATGTAFFAGITERGRTDKAVLIHNMDDYTTYFGNRVNYGLLYDACDAAFQCGCTDIYVGRVVGPGATVATHTFNDAGAAPSIAVDQRGGGASTWSAAVVAGAVAGTAHVVVTDADGNVITSSPDFAAPTDFANWSTNDPFINIRALGANVPAALGATALAGGDDDRANIVDATKAAAYPTLFPAGLGVGQLAYPGATTTQSQVDLANFAQLTGRVALLDETDTADIPTLTAAADALRSAAGLTALSETFVLGLTDWHVIAGVATGTVRTVPSSAIVAGLIAASDGKFGNPNLPAAGANGESPITIRLSHERTDADRQTLNDKGLASFKNVYGVYRLYGYRTLAASADVNAASAAWGEFSAARTRMAVTADLLAIGEDYVFSQLDGQNQTIARWNGAIRGRLMNWWSKGALFGASAADAFSVDTGPTVNTPVTIQDQQIKAKVGLKTSPFAELAYFEVTKVAVTGTV